MTPARQFPQGREKIEFVYDIMKEEQGHEHIVSARMEHWTGLLQRGI